MQHPFLAELKKSPESLNYCIIFQNWRIETPLHTDSVTCMNKIFEGTELLKKKLDMNKFGAFFQKFERLKQSLTLRPGKEEECDTERKNPKIFIEKLTTFIRKSSKTLRAPSY
uniref:Interleukin-5 n=1 Tax=Nothoprocta perdicaria TaxID=30464 RepID=A0A8C6YS11_NOTPE